ncbi:hypothetical protein Nepgr_001023 [Nepenthes gracilis]|uniref:Uncharacterized protein n=1 Tax=Nepenthes gracilis TaxID=150966 RepID=A0AAD3P7I0_NEPGR|nr:hypothetical protein Nepgr_001023 [Nepenthes gracilis]
MQSSCGWQVLAPADFPLCGKVSLGTADKDLRVATGKDHLTNLTISSEDTPLVSPESTPISYQMLIMPTGNISEIPTTEPPITDACCASNGNDGKPNSFIKDNNQDLYSARCSSSNVAVTNSVAAPILYPGNA